MPDGGSDCCGICAFNRARTTVGSPFDPKTSREQFWAESFCMLREIKITLPFWTYCNNYTRSNEAPDPKTTVIDGPAYASGLFEGWYTRIPWHGKLEPLVEVEVTCEICGKKVERGIRIDMEDGSEHGFCCNDHYVQWVESRAAA